MASVLDGDRLSAMIEVSREKIKEVEADKPGMAANLDKELAVDFEEHFKYQQLQAEFHAAGRLTPDAAQIVYVALGEIGDSDNGGWAAGTDLATKVIVTQLMGELLRLKLAQRGVRVPR